MANIERWGLALQLLNNTYNLILNLRENAAAYKNKVTEQNVTLIAEEMKADAQNYLMRIEWNTQVVLRNQTLVTNALTDLALTLAQFNSLKTTLEAVCNHTLAATLTTVAEINAEADWQLNNSPTYERVY